MSDESDDKSKSPIELKYYKPTDDEGEGKNNPAFTSSLDSLDDKDQGLRKRNGVDPESLPPDDKLQDDVDEDDEDDYDCCSRQILRSQNGIILLWKQHKTWIYRLFLVLLFCAYIAYFIYAMYYRFGDEGSYRLLGYTVLGAFLLFIHFCWKYISPYTTALSEKISSGKDQKFNKAIRWFLYFVAVVIIIVTLIIYVILENPDHMVSLGGLAAFILITYLTSINPAKVNWHPIFWGLTLQYFFALIILKTTPGRDLFQWLGDRVTEFLSYSDRGAKFVFGDTTYTNHFFAFKVMPVVTFFSTFIAVLYYLGIMQAVVKVFGRFLSFCLGTTPAESLNAAGNIFVGMTEAPLMIKPFLSIMTKSELCAVMVGGFATIAGSVFGAYLSYGVPGEHLLSASVMSAPAALAIAKLTYPETEKTRSTDDDYDKMVKGKERNVIEAASSGASLSIGLIANIVVNLIAFLAILEFVNACLLWAGHRVGVEGLTFEFICSYVLFWVSLFMGVEIADCRQVAKLVGVKTFTNEFIAYERLSELLGNKATYNNYTSFYPNQTDLWEWRGDDMYLNHWNQTLTGGIISERSEVIATYALCGFSNIGSMGILLGGLSALAPERRSDLSGIVFRAMIAGNVACFFTACIAGLFFTGQSGAYS